MCLTLTDSDTVIHITVWSVGLMDKASASGAGDSRFESWADHHHRRRWHASADWRVLAASLPHRSGCQSAQVDTLATGSWRLNASGYELIGWDADLPT